MKSNSKASLLKTAGTGMETGSLPKGYPRLPSVGAWLTIAITLAALANTLGTISAQGKLGGGSFDTFRSDQIGLSLPSPHASTCGMGVVHTLPTQRVTVNSTRAASELVSSRDRGIGVDEPYLLI